VPRVADVQAMWVTVIRIRSWKLEPGVAEVHAMWVTVISIMFMLQQTDSES
jgi:hypothetical protein